MVFYIISSVINLILLICVFRLRYDNMVKDFEIEELLKEIKNLKHED